MRTYDSQYNATPQELRRREQANCDHVHTIEGEYEQTHTKYWVCLDCRATVERPSRTDERDD